MQSSNQATRSSALRAVLALPVAVAGVVPLLVGWLDPWRGPYSPWGLAVVGLGGLVVGWTVRDFFHVGRGTLAPWDPPRRLVTVGLFSRCRNPMYLGVLITIAGLAMTLSSVLVAAYGLLAAVVFHLRVLLHEEPWVQEVFPEEWPRYCGRVPRWLPRRTPWRGESR